MTFTIYGEKEPLLHVNLKKGEKIYAESGSMVTMDQTLKLDGRMQGGILSAIGRKFANGESFFNQFIEADTGEGDTLLAPSLPGDIKILDVGAKQYYLNDGAFLASDTNVNLNVQMQNIGNALFGGTGGFFIMKTSGQGKIAVSGFGEIFEIDVVEGNEMTIDNQHVVAWDQNLSYNIGISTNKSSGFVGNLINSVTSGEGIVTKFRGNGKVYLSSRNIAALIASVTPSK
jgi:uncharacterized protein (TIGR00266 family)